MKRFYDKYLRSGRLAILVPAALSLLILWRHYRIPDISMDGVTYLQIARNILGGRGLDWQALWAAPLHSILIASVSFLTRISDLAAVAGIVSPLMGFCLVLATYFLAATLLSRRQAIIAASLAALFPHLITISFSTEGEITYTFFLVLAVGLFSRAILAGSYLFAGLAGAGFALAYLSRSEGFLIMVLVLTAVTMLQGRRFHASASFRLSLTAILVFLLIASPYLFFLHKHYGSWVVSPKASYVMIWMKSRIYHDNDKGEMENEELWGLSPEGKLRWQEPKGAGDLVRYLLSHPGKSAAVYFRNFMEEVPGRIPNNSGMERYPQVFPVYVAILALLAACVSWGEASRLKKALLFSPLLVLFILPVFTGGWWKYLVPYLPFLLIASAQGLSFLQDAVSRRYPFWGEHRRSALLVILPILLFGILWQRSMASGGAPIPVNAEVTARRSMAGESRKAGAWAVSRFGRGVNYMAPWSRIIYYLDGYWTALPVADLENIIAYGRSHRAELVVREVSGEMVTAGELTAEIPGLELVDYYRSPDYPYGVSFYRFR